VRDHVSEPPGAREDIEVVHDGMRPWACGNTGAGWLVPLATTTIGAGRGATHNQSMPAATDLDDADFAILVAELKRTIAADPFSDVPTHSTVASDPGQAGRRAEPFTVAEEGQTALAAQRRRSDEQS
jgi:hypothetical protein